MTPKNKPKPATKHVPMTVPEVAAHFGVSMETVRRWNRGEGGPYPGALKDFPRATLVGRSLVFDRVAVLAWGTKQ